MKLIAPLLALLVLAAPAAADDPPQSIDTLVQKLAALRGQQAELAKLSVELTAELQAAIDALNKKLKDLGVGPIVPPAPTPPDPKPPGPKPADPFTRAVREAYLADPAPTRADQLATLAELYRQAADLAGDPSVGTAGELVVRVREAAKVLKIDGLAAVRKLVAAEVAAVFPTDAPLTAETRAAGRTVFARISNALTEAGK